MGPVAGSENDQATYVEKVNAQIQRGTKNDKKRKKSPERPFALGGVLHIFYTAIALGVPPVIRAPLTKKKPKTKKRFNTALPKGERFRFVMFFHRLFTVLSGF